MASIRRTLSPVPRPGTALNGEACSVASPLSRSSSCAQSHPPSGGGLLSALSNLLDSQAFVLGVFWPRTSRPLEKSKLKGIVWRRALFQFFICFVVGVLIGFTPFSSMTLSTNLMSKPQAFSFEMITAMGNFQPFDDASANYMPLDNVALKENATLESQLKDSKPVDSVSEDTIGYNQSFPQESELESRKLLIIVTPTYIHSFQAYYLNRLAHTLKSISPPLLWIVVEMTSQSAETADLLRRTGVMYRHLVCNVNITDVRDRRVHQRNVALSHIETHHLDGVVYFADDDYIYSTDLFAQMRQIRRFGVWTVAKVENKNIAVLEGPVCNGTEVIGWRINGQRWRFRRFHAEITGFAFNSTILWDPKRWHRPTLEPIRQRDTIKDALQVSTFIEQIVEDESQMEGLLEDCSRIMVWHLHLESADSIYPHGWFLKDNLDVIASLT